MIPNYLHLFFVKTDCTKKTFFLYNFLGKSFEKTIPQTEKFLLNLKDVDVFLMFPQKQKKWSLHFKFVFHRKIITKKLAIRIKSKYGSIIRLRERGVHLGKIMTFIKLSGKRKRFIEIGFQNKKYLLNQFDKSKYFFENFSQ